jgi:hypothetical protein
VTFSSEKCHIRHILSSVRPDETHITSRFIITSSGHEKWFVSTSSGHEKWFVTSSNLRHLSFQASLIGSKFFDRFQFQPIFQVFGTPSETNGQITILYLCARVVLSGTALLQFHLMKSLQPHCRIAFLCYIPCSCWIPTKDLLHLSV